MPVDVHTPTPPAQQQEGIVTGVEVAIKVLSDAEVPDAMRAVQSDLLGEAFALKDRVAAFLGQLSSERKQRLSAELQTLKEQCRKARSRCAQLEIEEGEALQRFNTATNQRGSAELALRSANAAIPSEDTWPEDSQVAAAEKAIAECRAALGVSQRKETDALTRYNAAIQKSQEGRARLRALAEQEKFVRYGLEGKRMEDPQTGLVAIPNP
jgi:chromosome segregation ATPase